MDRAFHVGVTDTYVLNIAPLADMLTMSGDKNLIWSPVDSSENTLIWFEEQMKYARFLSVAFVLLVYPGGCHSQGHVIPPACSGSAPGSPPSWTCPDYLRGGSVQEEP